MFVLADCENQLIRDPSKGLEGGSFFLATLLNRKEAKSGIGKHSFDALKDYMLLKGDGRLCQYFFHKYLIDPEIDSTPEEVKRATPEEKEKYLHQLVSEALVDLLPIFKHCTLQDPMLTDHPLQKGRRFNEFENKHPNDASDEPSVDTVFKPAVSHKEINKNIKRSSVNDSSRSSFVYSCKICSFSSKYKSVCETHVETCLVKHCHVDSNLLVHNSQSSSINNNAQTETSNQDFYWNYKNAEFLLDSLLALTTVFEDYGDGLGFYITNKILLPIFHGLKHSNYTCSIHRFITRILCETTPREGAKLLHERFSNRTGKPGENVCRDRRMEFRVGTAKKLIKNLASNISEESVMNTNKTLDIKERLFYETRKSHGVYIRKGNHNPRSDADDYRALLFNLQETRAERKIAGRTFGDLKYPENLLDDQKFDQTAFYRWIIKKNKESKTFLRAKK